jgi:putative transcriptional regulator
MQMADLPSQETPIRLQGQMLLADPSLREGTFHHSVILVADHSPEDGTYGLILNQPGGHLVGDFLKDEQFAPLARIAVHVGGPVARQHLTFAAFWWTPEKGLRFATRLSAHDAVRHARNSGTLIRAFVGYSGWAEGQLEAELRRRSWIMTKPSNQLLGFTHDEDLWSQTLRGLSPFHRILAEAPEHPEAN